MVGAKSLLLQSLKILLWILIESLGCLSNPSIKSQSIQLSNKQKFWGMSYHPSNFFVKFRVRVGLRHPSFGEDITILLFVANFTILLFRADFAMLLFGSDLTILLLSRILPFSLKMILPTFFTIDHIASWVGQDDENATSALLMVGDRSVLSLIRGLGALHK